MARPLPPPPSLMALPLKKKMRLPLGRLGDLHSASWEIFINHTERLRKILIEPFYVGDFHSALWKIFHLTFGYI